MDRSELNDKNTQHTNKLNLIHLLFQILLHYNMNLFHNKDYHHYNSLVCQYDMDRAAFL